MRTFKLIFAWILILSETIAAASSHFSDAYEKHKHLIPEPLPEDENEVEEQEPREGVVDVKDESTLQNPEKTFHAETPEQAERNLDIE